MQDQINGTVGLATLGAVQPLRWQAADVGEYERSLPVRHADIAATGGAFSVVERQ
jgi:hypothetical protein